MRSGVITAASLTLFAVAQMAQAASIGVQVNGEAVRFPYAQPMQIAGRVMVPLRGVLERLGSERILWRPQQQEVFVAGPAGDIRLWIGQRTALVDGRRVSLDVPPMIMQGTTMVPLRFVSESLGARVDWMPQTQTVYIATANEQVAGAREQFPRTREDQGRTGSQDINDRAETRSERRQERRQEGRLRSPYLTQLSPAYGSTVRDPREEIVVSFRSQAPIDFNTVHLFVNGREVTPDIQITTEGVRYLPPQDLPSGRNNVRLSFRDTSGAQTIQEWHFFAP